LLNGIDFICRSPESAKGQLAIFTKRARKKALGHFKRVVDLISTLIQIQRSVALNPSLIHLEKLMFMIVNIMLLMDIKLYGYDYQWQS